MLRCPFPWLVGEVTRLCEAGKVEKAICVAEQQAPPLPRDAIYPLLRAIEANKAALGLEAGRRVQSLLLSSGLHSVAALGDHLIRFFASCGSLPHAHHAFSHISKPTVYTWSAIIGAHAELGEPHVALHLYGQMVQYGAIQPDRVLYLSALKASSSISSPHWGMLIHNHIIMCNSAAVSDVVIGNTLVDMYAKCMSLDEARIVFNKFPKRTVVSFGAMITGYAAHGDGLLALEVFEDLQQEGMSPSKVTYLSTLKACGSIKALRYGRLIHQEIIRSEFYSDVLIYNSLVDMYAKCDSVQEACKVFDDMPTRTVASWGAIIAGCTQQGEGLVVCELYDSMQWSGVKPDKGILWCILKACTDLEDREKGRIIHEQIIRSRFESDLLISNALVDMYAKCGCLEEARSLFNSLTIRDVVSWGVMMVGYAGNGQNQFALELFQQMQQEGELNPNAVIFSCILKACGSLKAIEQGRQTHKQVVWCEYESDTVIASALIDMYVKCGSIEEARNVFDKAENRDVVSWGALLAGYASQGTTPPALELFEKMQEEGIEPNAYIYSCVLGACGGIGAAVQGRLIHNEVIRSGLNSDAIIGNTLVDMYARCGNPDEAFRVFEGLRDRDVFSWGAMIAGYTWSGNVKLAVHHLEQMRRQGLKPCDEIFTSILAACSHAGLLEEGSQYFKFMTENCGVTPSIEHYSCIVDLLCRAGQLNEAVDFLQTIAAGPDTVLRKSFLSSCRTYGNIELGRSCFDQIIRVNPQEAAGYVLMSSLYANAYKGQDFQKTFELRKCVGAWKEPGRAWTEAHKKVHEFVVGAKSQLHSDSLCAKLRRLYRDLKGKGYMPDLDLVLGTMEDDAVETIV